MKKLALLLAIVCVMVFSTVALAGPETDGANVIVGVDQVIDSNGYPSTRQFNPGAAWGSQTATVTVPVDALLPCYLEFTFQGNDMNATLQSFGPGSSVSWDGKNAAGAQYYIAFHPGLSGFLNDWAYVAGSNSFNAEIEPADGVFIRACDSYRSEIWSNMNYKYTVQTAGLTGGILTQNLPIGMRAAAFDTTSADVAFAAVEDDDYTVLHDFSSGASSKEILSGGNALKETTVYQQFRVPYNKTYAAGHYTGSISFIAATI